MADFGDNRKCCCWAIAAQACAYRPGRTSGAIDDTEVFFGCRRVALDIRIHRGSRLGLPPVDDIDISGEARRGHGKRWCRLLYPNAALCLDSLRRVAQLFAVVRHGFANGRSNLRKYRWFWIIWVTVGPVLPGYSTGDPLAARPLVRLRRSSIPNVDAFRRGSYMRCDLL